MKTNQPLPTTSTENPKSTSLEDNNSSDEEFDVAWERRAKQKARKEAASAPPPSVESPSKRIVRFSPSTTESIDLIELDLDETAQDGLLQTKDQNNNHQQQTEIVNLDDDETTMPATDTQSQITTVNIF